MILVLNVLSHSRICKEQSLLWLNVYMNDIGAETLARRRRLFATWGFSMFQGLGCSSSQAVHELGSECRETVRSISVVGIRALRGPFPSTRGLHIFEKIADALKQNRSITTIDLGGNNIHAKGISCIAEVIKDNNVIATLEIGYNPVGPDGAKALADVLNFHGNVKTLKLVNKI